MVDSFDIGKNRFACPITQERHHKLKKSKKEGKPEGLETAKPRTAQTQTRRDREGIQCQSKGNSKYIKKTQSLLWRYSKAKDVISSVASGSAFSSISKQEW